METTITVPMVNKQMVKLAGEHWTCSAMAQHQWAVALTRDGLERADILAVHSTAGTMVEVQVKATSARPVGNWLLGLKAQQPARTKHEWFVLIVLGADPTDVPRAYVVPRDHVAAAAWISHQDWLTEPDVKPGTRNTGLDRARVKETVFEAYRNRWDLMEHPTPNAPVLLPTTFRDLAEGPRVGLPSGHPWATAFPSW